MNNSFNHDTISTTENVTRPTRVIVDLNILRENFKKIKLHAAPAKVMIVLKANAYGHGLVRTAKLLQELEADYISVAVVEEGVLLRQSGITIPILVLGGIWGNQIPLFIKYNLAITASSIEKLKQINEYAGELNSKAKVHLKIDTGMERIGVHYYNSDKFIETAYKCENIIVEGIYSHFANADSTDLTHTKLQLERFNESLAYFDKHSIEHPVRHIANSGALLQMKETYFDMVRPGILFYGVYPSNDLPKTIHVAPALTWKSLVVYFKVIKPGHPVGYGLTWQSDENIRAVTIPVGYGDGYLRSMSGKAKVLLRGNVYPVIGTISMDQIIVNIGNDSAYNSDEVTLIGTDGNNSITSENLAEWAGTIPYEILTNINTRVPRIYLNE
ncbi:MAG: alanine racemase [Melioribacteraceae bacterium]|nr:alanine racemase [Melioribacteraceae bacterium]MCF8353603.1 alanine racemase [Melioribacteraceae bacterium]MCF8393526.1 alanine racemase [Melioribacteraceae bacterium]MCF8419336.1 alanine racemase [Melioribacteraceae bacterium]